MKGFAVWGMQVTVYISVTVNRQNCCSENFENSQENMHGE